MNNKLYDLKWGWFGKSRCERREEDVELIILIWFLHVVTVVVRITWFKNVQPFFFMDLAKISQILKEKKMTR